MKKKIKPFIEVKIKTNAELLTVKMPLKMTTRCCVTYNRRVSSLSWELGRGEIMPGHVVGG